MNKKLLIAGALFTAATLGTAAGSTLNAVQTYAQDSSSGPAPEDQEAPSADQSRATHVGVNGVSEELLTGSSADKVKSAALVAIPGGTIQRVETDAEGAAYEAHMTKPDGTRVTVKFDGNYNVTSTGGK